MSFLLCQKVTQNWNISVKTASRMHLAPRIVVHYWHTAPDIPRHAQDDSPDMPQMMPQTWPRYAPDDAPDMPNLCPRHAPDNVWARHANNAVGSCEPCKWLRNACILGKLVKKRRSEEAKKQRLIFRGTFFKKRRSKEAKKQSLIFFRGTFF